MDEREASTELQQARSLLKARFGYGDFRPGQAELVGAILQGRDCVGVMPTGAGKSICYQVPALAFAQLDAESGVADALSGEALSFTASAALTLVVSPLVSLMSDQVMALKNAGIPAAYLNSRLTARQQEEVLARASAGAYALMYVAPERLTDPRFLEFVGAPQEQMPSSAFDEWADAAWTPYDDPGRFAPFEAYESYEPYEAYQPYEQVDRLPQNAPAPAPVPAPAPSRNSPRIPIALVAVDEAHCVSQWGQDFRPSYLGIADFIRKLPQRPAVAAFTATATPRVAADIVRLLELRDPLNVTTGFDRPNLRFSVEQLSDKKKIARVASRALADPDESGIVYCSTRKDTERVHEALLAAGVRATRYHAGLTHAEREANQRAFVNDDAPVMVATNAFGMGIDKSNVRYVVHFNMPGSLEAYYQEAGRAGRDGEPSECLLLWNDADIATCRFFIEQESTNEALGYEEQQRVRASQRRRLAAMANYCMTCDCLRATILRYFGESRVDFEAGAGAPGVSRGQEGVPGALGATEEPAGHKGCGNCSNCTDDIDALDVTVTARSVMRCVHELRGRFGKSVVCDVLCGSRSAKIAEYGLLNKKTYGIVDDSAATVKEIIELLVTGEYLEISEGRYPLVGLGPRAREAATDEFRLYMKKRVKPAKAAKKAAARPSAHAKAASEPADVVGRGAALSPVERQALFERLRRLRKSLADAEGVPPYVVFSDSALRGMCDALPQTDDEFLAVSGVGPVKLKRYGVQFLAEIATAITTL